MVAFLGLLQSIGRGISKWEPERMVLAKIQFGNHISI